MSQREILKRASALLDINSPKMKWEVSVIPFVELSRLQVRALCASFLYQHKHPGSVREEEF